MDLNITNSLGQTLLHKAAIADNWKVVEMLANGSWKATEPLDNGLSKSFLTMTSL